MDQYGYATFEDMNQVDTFASPMFLANQFENGPMSPFFTNSSDYSSLPGDNDMNANAMGFPGDNSQSSAVSSSSSQASAETPHPHSQPTNQTNIDNHSHGLLHQHEHDDMPYQPDGDHSHSSGEEEQWKESEAADQWIEDAPGENQRMTDSLESKPHYDPTLNLTYTQTNSAVPASSLPSSQFPTSAPYEQLHHLQYSNGGVTNVIPQSNAANSAMPMKSQPTKQACIPCRKLKASCDAGRPCSRCVRSGRECIDRSAEEVEAARQRRKRTRTVANKSSRLDPSAQSEQAANELPPDSINSSFSDTVSPTLFANDPLSTSILSAQLYSRLLLAILLKSNLRNRLLELNTKMETLNYHLYSLIQWPVQCTLLFMHLTDLLDFADAITFFTNGLTPEFLDSAAFINTPLYPWTRLSTRPVYPIWTAVDHFEGEVLLDQESERAQMSIQWLPEGRTAFQAWIRMNSAKGGFQRALKSAKSYQEGSGPIGQKELLPANRAEDITSLIESISCMYVDPNVVNNRVAADPSVNAALGSIVNPDAIPMAAAHATWCPQSAPMRKEWESKERMKRVKLEFNKNMAASGLSNEEAAVAAAQAAAAAAASTSSPAPLPACLCELATPIKVTIRVNKAFERTFGYTQNQMILGYQQEGAKFMRHLYPPPVWPTFLEQQVNQMIALTQTFASVGLKMTEILAQGPSAPTFKSVTEILPPFTPTSAQTPPQNLPTSPSSSAETFHMRTPVTPNTSGGSSATAAVADDTSSSTSTSFRGAPMQHIHPIATSIQSRDGTIIPCIVHKTTLHQGEHGRHVTGFVMSWQTLQHPGQPQAQQQ